MSPDAERSGAAALEDPAPSSTAGDILDPDTIDMIEELHSAVVRAEAEQRFGLIRGRRTHPPVEAHAAEQAFLAAHGFATYNDFRLRIRRSTARAVDTTDTLAGGGSDVTAENSVGRLDDRPPRADVTPADGVESANDLRRRIHALRSAFQEDATELISVQIEQVDRQAGLIVGEASKEAADIIGQARRAHEAVAALIKDVTRQAEQLLAATADLSALIDGARAPTGNVRHGLGELSGRDSTARG
jgi:hypothetical protein